MAISNVIGFLESELVQMKNQGYDTLRERQHKRYDTVLIFKAGAVKKSIINIISDESKKQKSQPVGKTLKEMIGKEVSKQWSTVFNKTNIENMAKTEFRAKAGYAGVCTSETALLTKINNSNGRYRGGIWVVVKGKRTEIHFMDQYRYEKSSKFTGEYMSNAGLLVNSILAEMTIAVATELVSSGQVTSGPVMQTFSPGSGRRVGGVSGSAYESVSQSGHTAQHHITGDGAEVVGGSEFTDRLDNTTATQIQRKMKSGKAGNLNKNFGGHEIATQEITQGLTAEFDVLTWDQKTQSFVVKQDNIKLVVGDPKDKHYHPNDHDIGELGKVLKELETRLLNKYLNDPDMKTSKKSPIQNIQDAALAGSVLTIAKKLKKQKHIKVTHNLQDEAKDHKIRQKKKGRKLKLINSKKGQPHLRKYVGKKVGATAAMKSRVQTKTGTSPIALRTLLNTLLPRAVASKMVGGRTLQFRTGRFAGSAEVRDVRQGSRGGMDISYSYMKYPYQTFEPGFAQGSTFRDPRLLIGQSIRELATQIMGQKFTGTVRRL